MIMRQDENGDNAGLTPNDGLGEVRAETPEQLLAQMWQAYTNEQCGWSDSTDYHGHTTCDQDGIQAAGRVFSWALMSGLPGTINYPEIPDHFESKDEAS